MHIVFPFRYKMVYKRNGAVSTADALYSDGELTCYVLEDTKRIKKETGENNFPEMG
jgi:hypothetical protein